MKRLQGLKNPGFSQYNQTQVPKQSLRLDTGDILQRDANLLC